MLGEGNRGVAESAPGLYWLSLSVTDWGNIVLFNFIDKADSSQCHHWFPREMTSEKQVQKLGTLRSNDADDHENVKKTIGLIRKTTTSHVHHTFLYISIPFLHDYDVKMPNLAFCWGRKQATTKFYFSFWAWIWTLEIQLQKGSPTVDKVSW